MTIQEPKTKNNKNNLTPEDPYQLNQTLQELQLYNKWTPNTLSLYKSTLRGYCQFNHTTLPLLLAEAEEDEETTNKVSKRRIKKRLLQYILHLQQSNSEIHTIKAYLSRIKKIYRYHDIEIPQLPPLGAGNVEHYEDLPDRKMIQHVLHTGNTKTRMLVSLLASSGIRISDLVELTVADFMTACQSDVHSTDVQGFLREVLHSDKLIIPIWRIPNKKTGTSYITFSSDESSKYLAQHLLECCRRKLILLPEDKLVDVGASSITSYFYRLNKRLELGQLKTRNKFHPHALRKFFATTLSNNGCDFLSVEFMLGHKLQPVQEAYYKADPIRLQQKYIQYLRYLTFMEDVHVRSITSEELRELEELRAWKKDSVERIRHLEEMMNLLGSKLDY